MLHTTWTIADGRWVCASRRWSMILAALLACASVGCKDDILDDDDDSDEAVQAWATSELDQLLEDGLRHQRPVTLSAAEVEVREVILYRRQVAERMGHEAHAVLAPLALAAALFAPEGAVDLLLTVFPVHRVGEVGGVVRKAFKLRRENRKARELVRYMDDLLVRLDADGRDFVQLAARLRRAERRALKVIFERTGSPGLVHILMRRHLDHQADVRWIARMLERGGLSREFVHRYTVFDGDLV
ncbi:MAG: hypothetical protein AAGC55_28235, partial [Myxococcota bacterium]